MHSQGLRHQTAHVLVFNKAGQVFLQLRSQSKTTILGYGTIPVAAMWMPASYAVAAERDLMEEIGLLVEEQQELFKLEARRKAAWNL